MPLGLNLLHKLRALLPQSVFQRSIILLTGSTAIGQVITVLVSPLITRLYSPADFGIYATYSFVFSILLSVNSLRFEFAIPLPQEDAEALHVVGLGAALVVTTTILFTVGLLIFGEPLLRLLNIVSIQPYLWLLPAALLLGGMVQLLDYWSARLRAFPQIALARVLQIGGQIGTQISLAVGVPGPLGLLLAQPVGFAVYIIAILRGTAIPVAQTINPPKWRVAARKYINFPLFTTWTSLIDIATFQMPAAILNVFFSSDDAGHFSLAMRILGLPIALIGQAVAQVFYPTISKFQDDPAASRRLLEDFSSTLLVISVPLFCFVGVNGVTLFSTVFGSQWATAGLLATYLSPWFLITFITSPISTYSLVVGKQKEGLLFGFAVAVFRSLALFIGASLHSLTLTIGLFSLVSCIIYLVYLVWIFSLAHSNVLSWLRLNVRPLAINALILAVVLILQQIAPPLVTVVGSGLLFGLSLLFFGRTMWSRLQHV